MDISLGVGAVSRFRSRHYTLLILGLVYSCNVMDRNILTILLDPIRQEFGLNDSELGLLSGLSFAIFYALAGLPLGAAADRLNRRNLIVVCLTLWSGMTAVCGLSRTFVQLLVARIGVGIGEAGGAPAAMAMISDLFPARQRATAISAFYLASPVGAMAALAAGGWVAGHYGWRWAFLAAGVPGLILALVLLLTVREPRRGLSDDAAATLTAQPVLETLRFIASQRSLLHLIAGTALTVFVVSGIGTWSASFFIRIHGFSTAQIGPILALATGAVGFVGTLAGGLIVDRLGRRDDRRRCWALATASLLTAPLIAACVLVPSATAAVIFYTLYVLVSFFWYGPVNGLCQSLVDVRMRATISSVVYLTGNLLGFGLGSQIIGLLSDWLTERFGAESLRYGMLVAALFSLWAGLHFYLAARTVRRDLAVAASLSGRPR
ncbi:MAG: transporter [Rhodospirillales bacterium]|nr:transporter [Rhodospirillales bacterium]